jgi:hypothetical protein
MMSDTATIPPEPASDNTLSATKSAAEIQHFINDIDYTLKSIDLGRIQNLSFYIDDIPFYVTYKQDVGGGESRVCIQAVLGYLPFRMVAENNRRVIVQIVTSTQKLFNVRFGTDHHGRIFAAGNFTTDTLTSPDFIFFPLNRFLQEARPFIDLIGKYL